MTDRRTVMTVICFLGAALLLLIASDTYLIHEVISLDKITPESVALLVGISGLTGTALGSLGTMLASTKGSPAPDDPPTPVNVVNPPADPVQTADVVPPTTTPAKRNTKRTQRSRRS